MILDYEELKTELSKLADDEYREFVMKICPSERPFLGVRVPQIREIAKKVPIEKIPDFLKVKPVGYEEVLARGFLIARLPFDEMMKWFDSQIDCIDDWSTCDTFCSAVGKVVKKNKAKFFDAKMDEMLNDSREFAVRVGLVLLKVAYINEDYLQVIFDRVSRLASREEYYIRMGIAWLLCDCFIKYPTATTSYLLSSKLPKWTYNKTISKICDSYRVDEETKDLLRKMRRQNECRNKRI
ncbi:DNA alkylation repair protein [Candidatus Saccharibacteria bacterium]|nr:DNA alkylation repair protein [Candidatus Saccharibacteria bacterium]